eukprot:m51a1_g8415 hypothetical protein (1141) ;mRNA; r:285871-294516
MSQMPETTGTRDRGSDRSLVLAAHAGAARLFKEDKRCSVSLRLILVGLAVTSSLAHGLITVVPFATSWYSSISAFSDVARESIATQAEQFRAVVVSGAQAALSEHLQKSVTAANAVVNNLLYHPNLLNTTSALQDLPKFEPVILPVMRLFTGLTHGIHIVSAERLSAKRCGWTVYDRGTNNNSVTTFSVPMDTWKPDYSVVVARTTGYDPTGKPIMSRYLSSNASSQWMTYWDDEVRHQQVVLFLLTLPPWAAGPEADGLVVCGSSLDFLTPFFAEFPTSAHGLAFLFNDDENLTLLGSTLGAVTDNATNRPYTVWSHPTTTYRDTARAWLANTGGAREKASFTAREAMYDVAKVAQTAGGTSDAVWWIVLVSPVKDFTGNVLEQNDIEMANNRNLVLIVSATVLAGLAVLVVLIVLSSNAIVRQIGRINQHLECVSKMDFDNGIPEFRSIVSEIKDMANQTSKMTIALQTFNVYVPSAISAVEILEALDRMNAETFRPEMGMNMGVRIGISSGVVQAGNIGSSSRMNYTVLGDSRPVYLTGATCSTCLFESDWSWGERPVCALTLPKAMEAANKLCPERWKMWMVNFEWWTLSKAVEARGHWLLGSEYSNYYLKAHSDGSATIEMMQDGRQLSFDGNPEYYWDVVNVGDRVLVMSAWSRRFLRFHSNNRGVYQVSADAGREQATVWNMVDDLKSFPENREVHIITSRGTYLQTNRREEIKHFRKIDGSDPRTRWVIEQSSPGWCIKNLGTGKYMMTPDRGVETWWDKCDGERGQWNIRWSLVDDERGAAWTIWSWHKKRYLCAHGDDEDWVSVDRTKPDTWEHYTIVSNWHYGFLYTFVGKRPVFLNGALCSTCLYGNWSGERPVCGLTVPEAKSAVRKYCSRTSWDSDLELWWFARNEEPYWPGTQVLLGADYHKHHMKANSDGTVVVEVTPHPESLSPQTTPGFFWDMVPEGVKYPQDGVYLVQSSWTGGYLQALLTDKVSAVRTVSSKDAATRWNLRERPQLPANRQVNIITSRGTYLQTNAKGEIKHFKNVDKHDPKALWIFEGAPRGNCIKNVGTGKYMMTPDRGVETWWDKCDGERGWWFVQPRLVDNEHAVLWSIFGIQRRHYLCAHGDDENWVSVDRQEDSGWEHFDIVPA